MDDCPICYEPVNTSTGHCTLACKHSYHIACLTRWSNQEPTCPLCRRELNETEAQPRQVSRLKDLVAGHHIVLADQNAGAGLLHHFIAELGPDENPPPPADPPPNANRILRIGGGIEVLEGDVVLVMDQAHVTRGEAVRALRHHEGDIVNAIMLLVYPPARQHTWHQAARDPLVDPADDQTTTWFLQRMFREEAPQCLYPWNSCEDLRLRMNLLVDNRHDCWKHADFNNIEPTEDGYETA